MGLKMKRCVQCGDRKPIGGSKSRCKACRRKKTSVAAQAGVKS